ncbi:ABC transporter ATP-binding protein [Pseudodonghicola flavimaris]|uniref:ABC transporter ATP-binding protein n=1 Tax=Pseudodonghicola flavimaris TaxID=3050036 RepID=A0ABT7F2M7_9RHOB|nr:ABC transporter ATP-binding protein [Pseudodonghicola flavimaris]MDK3018877.1 ABC transporter ATP-binding protein [Pseudodonghicola flavimaris]
MSDPILSVRKAVKTYGEFRALDAVDLDIREGEFLTLLGPSGSGKTTLLSAIAGFTALSAGEVHARGSNITRLPPEKRDFAMVFQGYALFPTMTVAENVGYPLRVRKYGRSALQARVRDCLDLVQMGQFADRMPHQLSGGQQQRIALARALSFEPDVLLLDEPLSALDKKLRADLQWELKALHERLGVTFIYVTHDQDEALSMSDRIVILKDGAIQQEGAPGALYDWPRTRFVANFLGKSNFISADVVGQGAEGLTVEAAGQRFTLAPRPGLAPQGPVSLALRPERIRLGAPGQEAFTGRVRQISYLGERCQVLVDHDVLGEVLVSQPTWHAGLRPEPQMDVSFGWGAGACVPLLET